MTRTFIEVPTKKLVKSLKEEIAKKTGDEKMSILFDDLKQGLEEAIDYEKGNGTVRTTTYTILPVKEYSGEEIRAIRMKSGMTQSVFASYMGVSKKTVEAWEGGRTHPLDQFLDCFIFSSLMKLKSRNMWWQSRSGNYSFNLYL